jgi:histone H3/H4
VSAEHLQAVRCAASYFSEQRTPAPVLLWGCAVYFSAVQHFECDESFLDRLATRFIRSQELFYLIKMSLSEFAVSSAAARSHLKDAIGICATHAAKAHGISLSQQSIAAIQASAINFTRTLTSDIEMFARHRCARTISTSDLKMALRKSEALIGSVQVAEAAFAENMLNPQPQRAGTADGSRKRGRPPKNSASNSVVVAAAGVRNSPAAVTNTLSQLASENHDMLPRDSDLEPPPPRFKPPRSRIVSTPSLFPQHPNVIVPCRQLLHLTASFTGRH